MDFIIIIIIWFESVNQPYYFPTTSYQRHFLGTIPHFSTEWDGNRCFYFFIFSRFHIRNIASQHCAAHRWHFRFRKELDDLQKKIQVEREKYQVTAQSPKAISAVPKFNINDKFILKQVGR